MSVMGLINTVLGYKKGSKTKNIFSMSENMMFELSNALSIVFISLKLVKIRQVKVLSVAPPKGHESLPRFSSALLFMISFWGRFERL